MTDKKTYCDSCGEDVKNEVYTLDKYSVRGGGIWGDNRTPFDLCYGCFNILCSRIGVEAFKKFPNLTDK